MMLLRDGADEKPPATTSPGLFGFIKLPSGAKPKKSPAMMLLFAPDSRKIAVPPTLVLGVATKLAIESPSMVLFVHE